MQTIKIDDLTYTYKSNSSNQLAKVSDNPITATSGFKDGTNTGDDYTYDPNGNLQMDQNKNITAITYNHLNLPLKVTFGTTGNITYIYNAVGQKVQKTVTVITPASTTITNYLGGYQYQGVNGVKPSLQFFPTTEGYVKNASGVYSYVFNYMDHLGNVRLSYSDSDKNGQIATTEILEESNYYPFGLKHNGYTGTNLQPGYKYKYNGKELQDDNIGGSQLNWYDYGARNYDPALGRWMNVDPLAEKYPNMSPYAYCANNPINAIDPDGRLIIFVNGMWGTGTGAIGGGTASHWGQSWILAAQNRIGDYNARFYDGSSDWTGKTGGMSRVSWNMDAGNRYNSGYAQGGRDAVSIVNSLERGSNGQITESIKMVTSSMGAAYSRGMTQAIVDYVGVQNKAIDAYNNGLAKDKQGNYLDPSQVKQRLNVVFEFSTDLDAFQANQVGADPNTNSNYFMKADGWESYFIGGKNMPGSTEIGNSIMEHHHPSWAPADRLPKGKMNPSSAKKPIENPTN